MTQYASSPPERVVAFDTFRLFFTRRVLLEGDRQVHLGSRALEILFALLDQAGEVVTKARLMQRVWPDVVVEEGTLRVHIASLRKVLGEGHSGTRYVENVTGHGYRFVAPITVINGSSGGDTFGCAPDQSPLPAALHRLRITDVERRRLARRAHALARKALSDLDTLVTPDTLMRWYRKLVAQKWTYTHRRGPGRPPTVNAIVQLIVRMALENRSWGYTRIQGALANLGHRVGRGTIANVLHEHGINPAPERGKRTSWSTFLKAHWESIAATDFFTVEVFSLRGLVTHYVLFILELASRTVKTAGITTHPYEGWMMQMARNLTDAEEPFLRHIRFLIMDRDTKYSATFRAALTRERIEPIRLPPRSPNLNAFAERFVRSVKEECVGRMVFFGRSSLERALTDYVAHYHEERNHQGLRNQLLQGVGDVANRRDGPVKRRQRLGGMLNFYHREEAA